MVFSFLNHKPQPLNFPAVFKISGHDINPCGIDAAMAENISQFGDVFLNAVKGAGKKFAQVVGEYLLCMNARCGT